MVIEANAARVIKAVTNTPFHIPEGAEVINMCHAVEEMINESKEEGRAEGKLEGAVIMLVGLVKDGIITIKEAAKRANMSESMFEEEIKKLSV